MDWIWYHALPLIVFGVPLIGFLWELLVGLLCRKNCWLLSLPVLAGALGLALCLLAQSSLSLSFLLGFWAAYGCALLFGWSLSQLRTTGDLRWKKWICRGMALCSGAALAVGFGVLILHEMRAANYTMVEEVISGAVTKFRKRFPDIEVISKIPDDVLLVPMDAILIEQVIVNLLENCVLHADGMTKIWLIVTEDGDRVKFSIEDNGAGIKESVLPRMFDGSFQSEDGKESDSKRNMGIGLSVCMTIVRAHDGIMKAENRKEGGARVMFWLPKGVDTEYGD
mgnify:CR=1 FL=1